MYVMRVFIKKENMARLLLYMAKYRRNKILVNVMNDSQFVKFLPNQNLPLKYIECRAEVIRQSIIAKSLVEHTFTKISLLRFIHKMVIKIVFHHYIFTKSTRLFLKVSTRQ